jgi:AraC-like DNA-binding protein
MRHLSLPHLVHALAPELAPNAYLTRIRLQAASLLLQQSTLPVKEIAGRVGLPDEAYFIRLFKKATGVSPMHYRSNPPGRSP